MADETGSMSGKTVLVTGATSGIGEIAARELAAKGARVVLKGRGGDRGLFSKSKLAKATAAGRDDATARRLWTLSESMVSTTGN